MSLFDPSIPANVPNGNLEYNGSAYEHVRANFDEVLMAASSVSASTAVTATCFGSGIIAWAEITSGLPPGSASVTFALKVQAIAPVGTNRFVTLARTNGSLSSTGIVAVMVGPGLFSESTGASYAQASRVVPRNIRILASISSGAASFGMVLALGLSQIK